jgi:SRF-type transcription factor (DNA-binding and dimerisation domain)
MAFQPIQVVRRRRLDTKRAKRQQQTRRKDSLFKKAREYSLECDAYVYLTIKFKKNGRIFTFNSDSTGEWPLPEAQMVRHPLKGLCDTNREQDNYYPPPIRITLGNFEVLEESDDTI